MAISDLYPKEVITARGQVGKQYIFYVVNGYQRKRAYAIPDNPRTARQKSNRSFFKNGVKWWQSATEVFREGYFTRVQEYNLKTTPFAEFIKDWYEEKYVMNCIKSIQRGNTLLVNGNNDITIEEVDLEKSVLICNSYGVGHPSGPSDSFGVQAFNLLNSTTIRITAFKGGSAPDFYGSWQVVEFY